MQIATQTLAEWPQERDWINRKEAARYMARRGCPVSVRTLERWAANGNQGEGPPYTRVRHRIVRYLRTDLDQWIEHEAVRVK